MGELYLTDLADRLRGAGLEVVEMDGWQTRARSTGGYADGVWCVVWHHTASSGDGADDAFYCCHGDDDAPVCNLVVGRDGVVYVCAAGATNCNGKGGPFTLPDGRTVPADSMNTRAVAIELSNNGVGQPYPVAQVNSAFVVSNVVTGAYVGRVDNVVQHVDWSPGRKIDPATAAAVEGIWKPRSCTTSGSWNLDDLRAECRARSTQEDDDMTDDQLRQITDRLDTISRQLGDMDTHANGKADDAYAQRVGLDANMNRQLDDVRRLLEEDSK